MPLRTALCAHVILLLASLAGAAGLAHASDLDEFKVKREQVFEFAQQPAVTRNGDHIVVTFESKGYCDATVAIEDNDGRIIRHLASGVLGKKAPPPFQKDSLKQQVVWDGKDDQGKYVDDKDSHQVRVSLGLKPEFEKNLYWSPYKRFSQGSPLMTATPEGVLVYEGLGCDSVKLFGHDGKYVRTVYPFPANKLEAAKGLDWKDFPQGFRLPWKQSAYQQTLLTSGDNANWFDQLGRKGHGATGMAERGGRIALAYLKLNRLGLDGTTGGLELTGGKTCIELQLRREGPPLQVGPTSVAISPDGKTAYLAGYATRHPRNFETYHVVQSIPFDGSGDAKIFAGEFGFKDGRATGEGNAPGKFTNATSVDCDEQGRVYVSDYMNDRIQIFSPDGKVLKEVKVARPALVRLNRKNGQMYVFSWCMPSWHYQAANPKNEPITVTKLGPFEDPKQLAKFKIPGDDGKDLVFGRYGTYTGLPTELFYTAEIDSWTEPPTIWFVSDCRNDAELGVHGGNGGRTTPYEACGIRIFKEKGSKLEKIADFGKTTVEEVVRAKPPSNAIQHCYVNPVNGKLYLAEADSAPTVKASGYWLEIDPESAKIKELKLPFNPVDAAFDLNGYAYLRNTNVIVRYDSRTWREIPWDYGEEFEAIGRDGGIGGHSTPVISGLVLPSQSPVCYHQGGINVSPKGYVIASCAYRYTGISGMVGESTVDLKSMASLGKPYTPRMYPGRVFSSTSPCIHVWDTHGKQVYEDAVPGVHQVDGVAMDRDDNIYFMHTATRMLDGKPYINSMSETLTKMRPKNGKIISAGGAQIPVPPGQEPKQPMAGKGVWIENAEWYYGGVGYAGFNASQAGGGCACWFSRFALDYYARSFVPEPHQFGVAVLDSAGNLVLRIGRYANVDSAGATSAVPLGGDEVGLFHPLFTGTHTDRRLFIADYGNGRLISVKLNYYADQTIKLKDIADQAK
ncbi:MAG: hypothetical protein L6R28_02235 [Planctomycetes bacterium]|nr:hypothetical protein [Planctomycetota bacterium]